MSKDSDDYMFPNTFLADYDDEELKEIGYYDDDMMTTDYYDRRDKSSDSSNNAKEEEVSIDGSSKTMSTEQATQMSKFQQQMSGQWNQQV